MTYGIVSDKLNRLRMLGAGFLAGVVGQGDVGGGAALGDGDKAVLSGTAAGPCTVSIPANVEGHGIIVDIRAFRTGIC